MEQLDTLVNLLNEEVLIKEIDQPLEKAINSFAFKLVEKMTYKEFNGIMASFYQYLNQHGLIVTRKLSNADALNEVIWLIENHYRGYETSGYDGAVFDALSQGEEGILLILERLTAMIKSIERTKYIDFIISSTVDPSNWSLRKELVKAILERFSHLFHSDVQQLPSAQLVPCLEDLLSIVGEFGDTLKYSSTVGLKAIKLKQSP